MKAKLILLLSVIFIACKVQGQSVNKSGFDSTYAIIQVTCPQTVFGEYEIKISYGNGRVEDFKNVDFSRKNKTDLINEITNALNYMAGKGYTLNNTLTYGVPTPNIQYIFEKRAGSK
jgi:hypothetical protein